LPYVIPWCAEGELVGNGPNTSGMNVQTERHTGQDRTGPIGRLPI
jgi:hypothetical protein